MAKAYVLTYAGSVCGTAGVGEYGEYGVVETLPTTEVRTS